MLPLLNVVPPPVKVPPTFKVPEPVILTWLRAELASFIIRLPETVAVPVDMVRKFVLLLPPVVAMDTEAQVNVPAPTAIVLSSPLPDPELIVMAPVTVKELDPLIVTAIIVPPEFMVSDAHSAATFTVTLIPLLITTSLAEVGTEAPPHVVTLFQLPETDAVLVCACNCDTARNKATINAMHFKLCKIVFMLRVFNTCFIRSEIGGLNMEKDTSVFEGNWIENMVSNSLKLMNFTS